LRRSVKEMENKKQKNRDEQNQRIILKEVVKRANKEEKQQHIAIVERQCAIVERLDEIKKEVEILQEKGKQNKYPEFNGVPITDKPYSEMTKAEFQEFIQQCKRFIEQAEDWRARHSLWSIEDNTIFQKKTKLINESLELKEEFYALKEKEKWLMLSIVLRSQPNLLKYMQEF
jgi:hypothetical protein